VARAADEGPVLQDRLLTDGVLLEGEFPPPQPEAKVEVKREHSYSVAAAAAAAASNGQAGSDGDSLPGSPLSLQDGERAAARLQRPMRFSGQA